MISSGELPVIKFLYIPLCRDAQEAASKGPQNGCGNYERPEMILPARVWL